MPLPSCTVPRAFSVFGQQQLEIKRRNLTPSLLPPEEMVEDTFLDARRNISPGRAISLFLLGFGVAVAGRGVMLNLLAKGRFAPKTGPVRYTTEGFTKALEQGAQKASEYQDEMNLSQGFDGLASVYKLALRATELRKALIAYLATMGTGYLAGSFAQGAQETWVRQEETKIRAELINRMSHIFRQSIRNKNELDNQLKENARAQIFNLLQRYQVPNAEDLVKDAPLVEPVGVQQRYFYEPTHRTIPATPGATLTGGLRFGLSEKSPSSNWLSNPKQHRNRIQAGIFGAGLFAGLTIQGFLRLFTGHLESGAFKGKIVNYETIRINALESFIIHGSASRQNLFIVAGFFAMSAAAKLGKLFIDGLREIEVTRVNARTELAYQTHNWLSQDPTFHEIAEVEALANSMASLEKEMPYLRNDPSQLRHRIQAILGNVGRNSAPKYFPMTPPVGLVVARA